jgi:hypothetical protein
MFIYPKISHLVHDTSYTGANKAQWNCFTEMSEGGILVLKIHALNHLQECIQIWNELASELFKNCQWIMFRDFKMDISLVDNLNIDGHIVSLGKRLPLLSLIPTSKSQIPCLFKVPFYFLETIDGGKAYVY